VTSPAPYQILPALDDATEAALRASIEKYGILVPIVVDSEGNVLDGHHRLKIANELEVPFNLVVIVPVPSMENLTVDQAAEADARRRATDDRAQKVPYLFELADDMNTTYVNVQEGTDLAEVARTLNLDRRHLTAEQRREIVTSLHEEGHSLRAIAGAVGVSKSQIEKDVKKVSTGGHLTPVPEVPQKVRGKDGKSYPAKRPRTSRQQEVVGETTEIAAPAPFPFPFLHLGEVEKVLSGMIAHVEEVLAGQAQFAQPEKLHDIINLTGALYGRLEYAEGGQEPPWYFSGEVLGKPTPPDECPIRPQAST
jgi:transposase-like protein